MTRILGIDPGSRVTGYGIVEFDGPRNRYVASGTVRCGGGDLPARLREIFAGLDEVIATHRPVEVAIEQVFMHRNADSALKLGQARGAAICACTSHDLAVGEYTPRQIKQAVVGTGAATKAQVQAMVTRLLALPVAPPSDAADALAVALCHGQARQLAARVGAVGGLRAGRMR
ncbi:MAG: crossover junction endodeoxyribonuclease RuvC [Gammaproteobacteria bacterium]|nr:crossover junction endodeoxyribonuclease RuvC [Gammaproteobacteria bacterium]